MKSTLLDVIAFTSTSEAKMHHFCQFSMVAGGQIGDFQTFLDFKKNSSALGSFNCFFESNSLKALFGQKMKKLKILKLSPDSRYLQELALKSIR